MSFISLFAFVAGTENIENGIFEANQMFGLDLSVKLREEVRAIESAESVGLSSVDAGRGDASE